jgi:putative tryptophan/tyrosine transport system substrate-binding protein
VKRREFITLLGGAAATWPLRARAQQPTMPVLGVLSPGTAADEVTAPNMVALREGLRDAGYVEGRNLAIEYRFAENYYERLPALASDLVRRQVAVIFASGGSQGPPAAKAATTTIPIVFAGGLDPIQSGLVTSLNRPGGNITGVSFASNISESKRLGLLHAMIPAVTTIGVLMNPDNASAETQTRDLNAAARALGLKLEITNARGEGDFERAFASLVERGARGLDVASDVVLNRLIEKLAVLAARYGLPAMYAPNFDARASAAAGGLMSYGASVRPAFHQAGIYIGRILHGEKPGDLPVMLPTNFQLAINLKTAKALGIEVPPTLSAIADEVIE